MTRKKKPLPFFVWHRRLGLIVSLLVIVIAITGIMLNHTEAMQLDEKHIDSEWLLNWYGIDIADESVSFKAGKHTITQSGEQVFFDALPVLKTTHRLVGAIDHPLFTVLAFDRELVLITRNGELIEQIRADSKIQLIARIGISDENIVIQNQQQQLLASNADLIDWQATTDSGIRWSELTHLPRATSTAIKKQLRSHSLTHERVILDLHSGRILGPWGIYLMDAAAIALLALSLSGFWVWWRRHSKQQQKRHYQKHHRF